MRRLLVVAALVAALVAVAAPAHAATSGTAPAPTPRRAAPWDPGAAGSGVLGPWRGNPRFVSTTCHDPAAPVGRRLLILGDSITSRWTTQLAASLEAAGWWPCIDAQAGRPTRGALDFYAGGFGAVDVVVMATGSNDVFDPAAMPVQVARARSLAGARPLVWVNVYVDRWSSRWRAADLRNSRAVNGSLRRVDVVDWYGFLARKASRPRLYLSDGVHTNAAGNAARTALLVGALVPYVPQPLPETSTSPH